MQDTSGWNWDPGKRVVFDTTKVAGEVQWMEELYVSPDGEKAGCVACTDEAEFGVCVNGEFWEDRYEKAVTPKFAPDGRLVVAISADMEWTLAVDGESWPEGYGFVWKQMFAGDAVATAVQQDMQYGVAINGELWETLFENANNFTLSPDGSRAACAVQVKSMAQADIATFQAGIYSVAVDGAVWDEVFVNCYTPTFSADGSSVAAQVRRNLYEYSIAVDGKCWSSNYQCVWEPVFHPVSGDVYAPVRIAGKWGMAKNGSMVWDPKWTQLWHPQFSADGENLYAICATDYGKFSVAKNKGCWGVSFPVMRDLVISPCGTRAAAVATKDANKIYTVVVDGKPWSTEFDMLFAPVFSPDSSKVAIRGIIGDKWVVAVDDKVYSETFARAFAPVFSPDSSKVLVKGEQDGKALRIVADVKDF